MKNNKTIPTIAGTACTKKTFLPIVAAPNIPATVTQPKKNHATFIHQYGFGINKDQTKPAAKKPLYKPWLAAIFLVFSKKSEEKPVNTFLALVVQTNISNHRK